MTNFNQPPKPPADPAEVAAVMKAAHDVQTNPSAYGQLIGDMRVNQPTHYAAAEQCEVLNLNPATQATAEHRVLQNALDPSLRNLPNSGDNVEAPQGLFSLEDYRNPNRRSVPEPQVLGALDKYAHDLSVLGGNMDTLMSTPLSGNPANDPQAAAEQAAIKQYLTEQDQSAQLVIKRMNAILAKYPDYSSFVVHKIESLQNSLATSNGDPLTNKRTAADAAIQDAHAANHWDTWVRTSGAPAGPEPHHNPSVAKRNAARAGINSWHADRALEDATSHADTDQGRSDFLENVLNNNVLALDLGLNDAETQMHTSSIEQFAAQFNTASENIDPALAEHGMFDNRWGLRDYTHRLSNEVQSLGPRSPRRRDLIALLNKALQINRQMAHYEATTRLENGTVAQPGTTAGDGRVYVEVVDAENNGILIHDGSNIVVYENGDMAHVAPGTTTPGPRLAANRGGNTPPVASVVPVVTPHPKWSRKRNGIESTDPLPYPEADAHHRRYGRTARVIGSLATGVAIDRMYELFDKDVNDWRHVATGVAVGAAAAIIQIHRDRRAQRKLANTPPQQRYAKST